MTACGGGDGLEASFERCSLIKDCGGRGDGVPFGRWLITGLGDCRGGVEFGFEFRFTMGSLAVGSARWATPLFML